MIIDGKDIIIPKCEIKGRCQSLLFVRHNESLSTIQSGRKFKYGPDDRFVANPHQYPYTISMQYYQCYRNYCIKIPNISSKFQYSKPKWDFAEY